MKEMVHRQSLFILLVTCGRCKKCESVDLRMSAKKSSVLSSAQTVDQIAPQILGSKNTQAASVG